MRDVSREGGPKLIAITKSIAEKYKNKKKIE
jgi:hypothetical protein